ncbi:enamine deaminase RidA [Amylibacter ulvae]|uniref:Enamine deaminase RidA n=1 Tax=Paramylibacter ulvae TaxID=1651968 RepID=A0ABQ3CY82_9RHOB|nr:RidA family protein [Amylibacter ulvae]GHA44285.1 enamine deaminase RidA [Amylibacter ulvae]
MSKSISRLNPKTLPDAASIGYSQISISGPTRLALVSGQVAWRRNDGSVSDRLEEQTEQVIKNLSSALDALDATTHDIVQMRIYMTDLNDETMAEAMGQIIAFLDGSQPSLTGVGVSKLAAPELQIEVEMVVHTAG